MRQRWKRRAAPRNYCNRIIKGRPLGVGCHRSHDHLQKGAPWSIVDRRERKGDFATPKLTATDLPQCQALSAESSVLFGWPQCVLCLFYLTILCPYRQKE